MVALILGLDSYYLYSKVQILTYLINFCIENDEYFVECYWYFSPLHTHVDRKTKDDHKFEIFLSKSRDVNSVNTLLGTNVKVLTESEWEARNRKGT